jgi:DNA primase
MHPKGFKSGQDLYGSWLVRQRHFGRAALVEGPLDAIACWDASVPALALHGSRCTDDQAKILRSLGVHTVVVMTDNDRPGDEVVHQIKQTLPGITVLVGWYRPGWNAKDPGELTPHRRREMFAHPLPYHKAFH